MPLASPSSASVLPLRLRASSSAPAALSVAAVGAPPSDLLSTLDARPLPFFLELLMLMLSPLVPWAADSAPERPAGTGRETVDVSFGSYAE